MALTLVGLFYVGVIVVAILFAHALYLAYIKGNALRVSEVQLPEIYERAKVAAQKLGLGQVPEIYVLQHGGMLNAFATRLLSRHYVILLSDLVDGCQDPRQLDFIIGHEMTHLAAGHLSWNFVLAPFRILPWVGPAYSRACEYTCDRGGHFVAGDVEQSKRALVVLAAGGKLAQRANLDAFMGQGNEAGGFWMAIHELVSSHPFLCKRVAAVQEFAQPGTAKPAGRNPFAYLFAPVLGASVGGGAGAIVAMMVIWVGLGAAIAVPMVIAGGGSRSPSALDSLLDGKARGGSDAADPFAELEAEIERTRASGSDSDSDSETDQAFEARMAKLQLDLKEDEIAAQKRARQVKPATAKKTTRVASAKMGTRRSVKPAKVQSSTTSRRSAKPISAQPVRRTSSLGVD